MNDTPIARVIEVLGSQAELARQLKSRGRKATTSLIYQWNAGLRPVAPGHCIPIEELTSGAVTRYDLRPDIFGAAPQQGKR